VLAQPSRAAEEVRLQREDIPGSRKTSGDGHEPAAKEASDALVGRRPLSRPPSTRRFTTLATAMIVLLASAALLFRYGWPRAVETFTVAKSALTGELRGPGTVDALGNAVISARVQGRITELFVDRNDSVAKGALIARIACDDLANQVAAAVASHDAAVRAVVQARADKVRTEATFANAETVFARKAALLRQGWATQADYDIALANRRQGEAELAHANAAIEVAEAQERSAAAAVEVNRAQLDEATVRAPFAGVVVSRDRSLGDLVTPGASIVQIADPSTVVLTARFDESAIATILPGQAAGLRFTSEPDRSIAGHVLRLSRQVDIETREFTVDIVPAELPANWAIGQRGSAAIFAAKRHDVLSVPTRAVVRRDGQAGLWVVVDGRARWRPVELGQIGGNRVEVRRGVADGDLVLDPGRVFGGMLVHSTAAKP